jgi:mRNA interferase MazF
MVGKILLAKIYFTDRMDYKVRPILIIKEYLDEDLLFLPLTTNLNLNGVLIENNDLEDGYLRKPSVIIIPKIGIIHKSLILKKIGKLKKRLFQQIMERVCMDMECINKGKP